MAAAPVHPLLALPTLILPTLTLPSLAAAIPVPGRVLVGFLALGAITIFGGLLRHRYIERVGGPDRTDVETIGCPCCGYQNRLHHEHCQYCRSSLADHPHNEPLNGA